MASKHDRRRNLIAELREKAARLAEEGQNPPAVRAILQEDLEDRGFCFNTIKDYLRVALR